MTVQEKSIIETILVDVGLESLHAGEADDRESKAIPVRVQKNIYNSEYSTS